MNPVPKRKYEKSSSVKAKCDHIYRRIIRRLAGFRCEITGKSEGETPLEVHHILKKGTLALRYSIKNGFYITTSLHRLPHSGDQQNEEYFESLVIKCRGANYKKEILAEVKTMSDEIKNIQGWLVWLKKKSEELGID